MTKEELINFWETSSDEDFKTMENLFNSKDYHWALFISHLVLEKLLKAELYTEDWKRSERLKPEILC